MFKTSLSRLHIVGLLEGSSFLILLLIAMPLKYIAGRPEAVQIVGAAHGLLWVLYLVVLLNAAIEHRWGFGKVAAGFIASVLPLGPFVFDAKVVRNSQNR